jgi:predicted anti-sigma-YlaC factor YlaD
MVSCKEASRLLSQQEDGPLSRFARLKLWLHLQACDKCTRFYKQVRFLRKALKQYRS